MTLPRTLERPLRSTAPGHPSTSGVLGRRWRAASERISRPQGWEKAPALTGEAGAFSARWGRLFDALASTLGAGVLAALSACGESGSSPPGAGPADAAIEPPTGAGGAAAAGGAAGRAAEAGAASGGSPGEAPVTPVLPDGGLGLPAGDAGAAALVLRGVCWNPVPVGATHPEGLDYAGFAAVDIPLMRDAGFNVVRTYEPLTDRAVLDALWAAGIRVIDSVYPWGGADPQVVTERVRAVKDHPAILYYSLGNEWNYNGLYVGLSHDDALATLNLAARLVKLEDATHPLMTIYGELPSAETIAQMPDIDVWGINAYRGISFGDLFDAWGERSDKPLVVTEYGADAYNANLPGYDPESQAQAAAALTREILTRATAPAANGGGARVLGGTIFEWADEWWKDAAGSPSEQEVGGVAPGGGPYPDQTFNEEWWGLVDVQRAPRPAYESLRGVFAEFPSQ